MKFNWYRYYAEADGTSGDPAGGNGAGGNDGAGDGTDKGGEGTGGEDASSNIQGDWPSDWRSKLSPDGKHSKTLDRFASPNALLDSYLAIRQRMDSGELKANIPFPDKGTPEEQVAWRKAQGIPEKPEDYKLKFADGLVIGEGDRPIVEDFLKAAHGVNASPEQVSGMLKWYYGLQETNVRNQEEADANYLRDSEDSLRAEWGGEYRTNINLIKGLISTLPATVRDLFANARLGDGKALLNNPDMARWLVSTARTLNPTATIVPGEGASFSGAIDDEIKSIENTMRTDRKRYNADEKMQARYRDLLDARERASAH